MKHACCDEAVRSIGADGGRGRDGDKHGDIDCDCRCHDTWRRHWRYPERGSAS